MRRQDIKAGLRQRGVRVVFACESGSRAWGMESADSDWDVRFVYVRPMTWYLSPWPGRDTIEEMDGDLDFAGWDLRKAVQLSAKSNPSFLEWLASEIVYRTDPAVVEPLKDAMRVFSASALMHHYVSLAQRQVKAYWRPGEPVRFKKYLYAIRPLMCVIWMQQYRYQMPPMDVSRLIEATPLSAAVWREVDDLLRMKRESTECGGVGRFPALDAFIDKWLVKGREAADAAPATGPDTAALERLFVAAVSGAFRSETLEEAATVARKRMCSWLMSGATTPESDGKRFLTARAAEAEEIGMNILALQVNGAS